MDSKEFQEGVFHMDNLNCEFKVSGTEVLLVIDVVGLTSELGELCKLVAERVFHGHYEIGDVSIARKLGNILWRVAAICNALGLSLSEIMTERVNRKE